MGVFYCIAILARIAWRHFFARHEELYFEILVDSGEHIDVYLAGGQLGT